MRVALFPLLSLALGCPKPSPVVAIDDDHVEGSFEGHHATARSTDAAVAELVANFSRVHFETDRADLTLDARAALEANAALLREHRELTVEVQGHADERGTIDYNIALGQRRARAVVDYLVSMGVAPSRLPVISYGEERPLVASASETAWAQNRRAEFRVVGGPSRVVGTTR